MTEAPPPYTFTLPVQLRWRDFDGLGHVNNATYLTFVEAARLAYQVQVIEAPVDLQPWMVAEIRCRYLAPINIDRVGHQALTSLRVQRLGNSSLIFAFGIALARDGGEERVAEGEVVQVYVDHNTGRPSPLPAAWRERIERYEAAPQHAQ